jgi:hypothetical protein
MSFSKTQQLPPEIELKNKIKKLDTSEDNPLFKAFEKKDFNLMFRIATVSPDTLEIMQYLYLHKEKFEIDPNKPGGSGEAPLDIAIENKSTETVVYLLKLNEVNVSDEHRKNIKTRFGHSFGKAEISESYIRMSNSLTKLLKSIPAEEDKCLTMINNSCHSDMISQLAETRSEGKKNISFYNAVKTLLEGCNEMRFIIHPMVELYDEFEEKHLVYLSYSNAHEKLAGKAIVNNINIESLLNTRITYKMELDRFRKRKEILLDHIEDFVKVQKDILTLILDMREKVLAKNQSEKSPSEEGPSFENPKITAKETSNNELTPKNTAPILVQNSLFKEPTTEKLKTQKQELIKESPKAAVKKSVNQEKEVQKLTHKNTTKTNKISDKFDVLLDDITALKQKGEVKLNAFLKIFESLAEIINIEIKDTSSGYLIKDQKDPNNNFSFHRPHNGHGVDKKAVSQGINFVESKGMGL